MILNKGIVHIMHEGSFDHVNRDIHKLTCFVINETVVDINVLSVEFITMFNNSIIEEQQQMDNEEILVSFIDKNTQEIQGVQFDERQGSIVLSNPILVEIPEESRWVAIGSKYIDGIFYP
jgi:hypothetical protein